MFSILRDYLNNIMNRRRLSSIGNNTFIKGKIVKRSSQSNISIGRECLVEGLVVTEKDDSQISIGDNVFIGNATVIDCASSITINDDVLISYDCIVSDNDSHSIKYSERRNDLVSWKQKRKDWRNVRQAPIVISKGAWIGARSVILKGVYIGEGAVVGAGSVVTKDVETYTIVAGNPAKLVRKLSKDER